MVGFKQLANWVEWEYLRGDGFELCEFETLRKQVVSFPARMWKFVYMIPRLAVHRFSTAPPYTQTSVNFNKLVKYYEEYFMVYS